MSERSTDLEAAIATLDAAVPEPNKGLPESLFLFTSRITPLINVDLLIKNDAGQTLLTWRESLYYPPGWHMPGGIIRYKEEMSARISAVAHTELAATVTFEPNPIAIREVIQPAGRRNRGHFISLLFRCAFVSPPAMELRYNKGTPQPGQWSWFSQCPENLLQVHDMYRSYI